MVQKEGSIWKRSIVNIRKASTKIKRTVLGTLVWLRLGNTIFDKEHLEAQFTKVASSRIIGLKMLEEIITRNIEYHNLEIILKNLKTSIAVLKKKNKERYLKKLYVASLRALATFNLQSSIEFGEKYLEVINDERAIQSLILFYQRCGHIEKPYNLLKKMDSSRWKDKQEDKLKKELDLLENGISYKSENLRKLERVPKNIMYHVNQSLPHHSSGYAIRTHALLRSLKRKDWNIEAYTRIGYPNDRYDFTGVRTVNSHSNVDGITYNFVPSRKKGIGKLNIQDYQNESVKLIIEQAKEFKPSLIHCASNYSCGLAGTVAAKLLGIPSIYEVRGLWHVTRTSKQAEYTDSDHYRMIEKLEAQAAMNADIVFAITEGVTNILIENDVAKEKIILLPNAVDTEQFTPTKRNRAIEKKFGFENKIVIGYIGSFTEYEGLDYLLEAISLIRENYKQEFGVILVGDGTAYDDLIDLRAKLELEDVVHFTGRIDHKDVLDYYSVIDIAVYPRKGTPVCEIVSPLKPLEAMAMGKTVIASDVNALTEMIKDNETGLLHSKDNIDDLTKKIGRLLRSDETRRKLGQNAKEWVRNNRTWNETSKIVNDAYLKLIQNHSTY
jgi:glycosyltransferase involved in cell wall biosynthesis